MRCNKRAVAALVSLFFLNASFVHSSADSPLPVTQLVYKKKYVMGTIFEIAAYDKSPAHASDVIDKAFQEVVRLDGLMSNYDPTSALSNLNRSAHFQATTVPSDLYRVIEEAVRYSRLSGGKFDISIAPLVNLWKAAMRGEGVPSLTREQELRACVGYDKIELTAPDRITLHSSCMQLDLGAIGKGYAVDRAAEILHSCGISDALINAGGSTIYAMGSPPGKTAWLVHLRDPSRKIDPQVMLVDASVSTSEQTPPSLLGKEGAGHIIDPDTGRPLQTAFAVSAIAKTATASDALSTILLLVGPAQGGAMVRSMTGVSAIWVSPEAQMERVIGGPQILLSGK